MSTQTPSSMRFPNENIVGKRGFEVNSSTVEGNLSINSEVGVILPTYCEAENIGKLIDEIENSTLKASILVIDDSSPDGTADIVRNLQRKYDNILLLVRPNKYGLGTAITDGFKVLLQLKNRPSFIITMDADYSHDPKEIQKLIAAVHEGCDVVIGSRYCRGGRTLDWPPIRLLLSKVANIFSSLIIRAGICDYTSGMRCYSTELVGSIIPNLHSQTYEIQIETIRQAHVKGFRITEVPITFINRKKGKSKLSINEIRDFFSYILSFDRI